MRMKLAQILLIEQRRPGAALKVMAKIDETALDPRQKELLKRLRTEAEGSRDEESYEVAADEW